MLPQERYNRILSLLTKSNVIKIEEIIAEFHISVETARRDLTYLESEGLIKKVYGGAVLSNPFAFELLSRDRLSANLHNKELIGKKCSEFILDGDSILFDVGTTTLQVAKALKEKKNLTVITNSIYIINELMDTDFTIYVLGGKIRHEEKSIAGTESLFELDHFHVSKAIIGAGAITAENGISDYNIEEAIVREKIITRSKQVILVADSTKFGHDALINVCPISSIHTIITDKDLAKGFQNQFTEMGVHLVFAG